MVADTSSSRLQDEVVYLIKKLGYRPHGDH